MPRLVENPTLEAARRNIPPSAWAGLGLESMVRAVMERRHLRRIEWGSIMRWDITRLAEGSRVALKAPKHQN
jgi:hypothetical protein